MIIPIDHRTISLIIEKEMNKHYNTVICEPIAPSKLTQGSVVAGYTIYFGIQQTQSQQQQSPWRMVIIEFSTQVMQCYKFVSGKKIKLFGYNFKEMLNQQHHRQEALENLADTFRIDMAAKIKSGEI